MGIPSYFKNLIDTYKEKTYSHIQDIDIDELYFDANSIIYDCLRDYIDAMPSRAQALYNIKQDYNILFDAVKNRLETYIQNINPSSLVFISFDGVVPLAKMKQ
jgi:5'-3' exonuclease